MAMVRLAGLWTAHWICSLAVSGLALALWLLRRQQKLHAAERWRERRMREELEAYARIDGTLAAGVDIGRIDPMEAGRALARRVCRVVAEKSVFPRVTMLLRNADGGLRCMGSVGVDDLTVGALHAWAEKIMEEEKEGGPARSTRPGVRSFAIPIGEWKDFDREVASYKQQTGRRERRRWRRAIVAPIRTGSGRMAGALVVCADGTVIAGGLERAMSSIEALAAKLAREFENDVLRDRLLRAEKLAGLGQLAGGVAHALNNPLTAVLGFAELIGETSSEPRVVQDAATIVREALKMRETVEKLVEFWRPVAPADGSVALPSMLRELAEACTAKLHERGVTLLVESADDVPPVRGSRDRLRQVMEHLLNNAAQAIATARVREPDEQHTIRITVSHDKRSLHVIVSDTGTGFKEPGRAFDPFYTTRGPEQGAGMGLSICYGIIREHGGEISAFNLHPHGAAVVVELPIETVMRPSAVVKDAGPMHIRSKT